MIKLIITDLDGTLLNRNKEISPVNKETLIEAQKKGAILALASGRGEQSLREYAAVLHMQEFGGYLICNNGQKVIRLSDERMTTNGEISSSDARRAYHFARSHGLEMIMEGDDGISVYTPRNLLLIRLIYKRLMKIIPSNRSQPIGTGWMNFLGIFQERRWNLISGSDEINETYYKIGYAQRKYRLDKAAQSLQEALHDSFEIMRVSDMWIDLSPIGVTKSLGMRKVMEEHGFDRSEVLAMGDSQNDLTMIRDAGIGVAMGNAMNEIKAIADDITDAHSDDGVAKAVRKYLF